MSRSVQPLLHLPRVPAAGEGLDLPGNGADSGSRNADTIPPCFGGFFCSFPTYQDQAERPEAKPQLVNPRRCQDPQGFLPSVKPSRQIPPNTFLMGGLKARTFPLGHLLAGSLWLPFLARQQPGFSRLEALRAGWGGCWLWHPHGASLWLWVCSPRAGAGGWDVAPSPRKGHR